MKTLSNFLKEAIETPKVNEFVILKPGFLHHEEDFCKLLKNHGWQIVQKQNKTLTPEQVRKLYSNVADQPFFNDLCDYMSSNPCLCCTCSKNCDDPCKDMRNIKAKIRIQWGKDDMRNCMHCSDSPENVINEIKCCMEGICEAFENPIDEPSMPAAHEILEEEFKTELIDKLQKAFAEEVNAWYQYIIVAPFLHGAERKNIEEFYKNTAEDELTDHGYWLLQRINELGGTPDKLINLYNNNLLDIHHYIIPDTEFSVDKSLKQNIEAENAAIETYKDIEAFTRNIDTVTNRKIKKILEDEENHLTELRDFLNDLN